MQSDTHYPRIGSAYGEGYSDGGGYGEGAGSAYGYGDGDGYGHGYGDGDGYGHGYRDGSGHGHGAGYQVRHLYPWPYIAAVEYQVHSVAYWRKHWRRIAAESGVEITITAMQDIFALLNEEEK